MHSTVFKYLKKNMLFDNPTTLKEQAQIERILNELDSNPFTYFKKSTRYQTFLQTRGLDSKPIPASRGSLLAFLLTDAEEFRVKKYINELIGDILAGFEENPEKCL